MKESIRCKASHACVLLNNFFGGKATGIAPEGSALDILVATILSQNTSDRNSVPAFHALKKRFPEWEGVLAASEEEVARTIRPAGLANVKARRIKRVLAEIMQENGGLDLSFLRRMPTPMARDYLLSFEGVGPKTAAVVLNFGFGKPVFPVDVHVYRVARRLGLVPETVSREKAQQLMDALVPGSQKRKCHLNMIALGRTICRPRNPKCFECPLNQCCAYFSKHFWRKKT